MLWTDEHYHIVAKLLKAAYPLPTLYSLTVDRLRKDLSAMFQNDNPNFSPLAFGNRCNPFLDYYENPNRNDYGIMSADYKHGKETCLSPMPCPLCDPSLDSTIVVLRVDKMGE